ncbi:MAG: hypothetical protein QM658_14555 [Gordonia sp. (in: high G+C Gram-positive bacteria)]
MTLSPAPSLRIAVELIDDEPLDDASAGSAPVWHELTSAPREAAPPRRIRVDSLGEAQSSTSRSDDVVFVDVDVLLADSVGAALARYRASNPGWRPGATDTGLVHPGTARSLAGLLWDIWAAQVADGVTLRLRSDDHGSLERLEAVTALLAARGVEFPAAEVLSA